MPMVSALYQYPIKGLSPQPVAAARLAPGQPFPFDRTFAFVRPGMPVNPAAPAWAKKGQFVMLMLDAGLARVATHLDAATLTLTVRDAGRVALTAALAQAAGRAEAEAFFHRLAPGLRAPPTLVRAQGGHFMDKPDNVISLLNLATVRSLEQQWGWRIDPLRFRANIVIDGARPWAELDWVGHDIRLGAAHFKVDRRNGRCAATNVDPATGQRDLDIPGALRRTFGHKDLGVYLVARNDAMLSVGDIVEPPAEPRLPTGPMPAVAAVPVAGPPAFICRGCYFVYDAAAGPAFADLPDTWRCPDCGTDKSTFQLR